MESKEFRPIKEGKVREIYDIGESLVMVATDRVSAFDVVLGNKISHKGAILTQMSKFWFDFTKDIIDNHLETIDNDEMPEFFRTQEMRGRCTRCKKLSMLPIECIVRGYITGSGWESYQKTGMVCGIELPEGLRESEKLPEPIYTPTTKAELGLHDEHITFEDTIDILEKSYPGKGEAYAKRLRDATLELYRACADYAYEKGILIADTKFEFGLDEEGEVVLADEMLTPDSSRFWPGDGYEPGKGQPSFDKQYIRDWLRAHPDSGYVLPKDVVYATIEKYKEAFLLLTGEEFAE